MSAKRKQRQLERHQRLHLLYEDGSLRKCLLSYFRLVVADKRLKLLKWMGSDLAADTPMPTAGELPKLPLRLAKIPEEYGIVGDKGFTGIERDMPNCNDVNTPVQLTNSKTHRLSEEQIFSDIPITSVRAPCETAFLRTAKEDILPRNDKLLHHSLVASQSCHSSWRGKSADATAVSWKEFCRWT